jgi:hypothetical protein
MPLSFPCDWKSGFVMDPTKKQRVGYLLHFDGLGLPATLPQDIQVYTPFNAAVADYTATDLAVDASVTPAKLNCVGVLESFDWGGGVGDPISISAYVSSENAQQIKAKLQTTLSTTSIKHLSWWIVNFDEENKLWFEEAYPKDPTAVTGQLNAPGKTDVRLHVDDHATKVAPNIDVNVYKIFFEIVPAANSMYVLGFALSQQKKHVKAWGLKVGTQAVAALPATA